MFLRYKIVVLLLIIAISLLNTICLAQNETHKFTDYTTNDGLTNNRVLNVFVDSENFIWVSTMNGFHRFDGMNFLSFKNDLKDSLSIKDNHIRCSQEDSLGRIWIGTGGAGICYYDKIKKQFHDVTLPKFPNASISQKRNFVDKNGNVWFGLNTEKNHLIKIDKKQKVHLYDSVWGLNAYNSEQNAIYLFRGSRIEKQFINEDLFGEPELIHEFSKPVKFSDTYAFDNQIWFCTDNDIYHINTVNDEILSLKEYLQTTLKYSFDDGWIKKPRALYVDYKKDLWVAVGHNLYQVKIQSGELINHSYVKSSINPTTVISEISGKRNGVIWLTFPNQGFGKLVIDDTKIKHYVPQNAYNSQGISTEIVRSVYADSNDLWIGTFNKGLDRYNFKKKKYYNYKFLEKGVPRNLMVRSVYKDGDRLWVCAGGLGNVYTVFDKGLKIKGNDFKTYKLDDAGKYIFKDPKNRLWIGTRKSLYLYVEATDEFKRVDLPININVSSIVFQEPNILWIGTWLKGLKKLTLGDHILTDSVIFTGFESFMPDNKHNAIPDNRISSLYLDKNGVLWIGTWAQGLVKLNTKSKEVEFERYSNNLMDNTVYCILEDDADRLWMSTNNGLLSINKKTNQAEAYFDTDGLLSNQFYQGAFAKSTDGSLIFGGVNGMVHFNPNKIEKKELNIKPYVSDIKIENSKIQVGVKYKERYYLNSDIKYQESISLPHNVEFFELNFNSLNYISPENINYSYKLEGFNKEFIQTVSNSPNAIFTKVPPGKYTLKIKAAMTDLNWLNEVDALKINIVPAWWQTMVFKIFMILLFIASLVFIYRVRVRNIKKQNLLLETKVKKRTKTLQEVNTKLKERNFEITEKKEEINQQNEELNTINEKLNKQNNDLEEALNNLRETQSQLVLSEKMASIGTLVSGIAHEINNPLNYIKGGKTLIEFYFQENLPEHNESLQPYLKMVDEGVFRAVNIVQSLNRFSRQSDDDTLIVNVNEIIDNCLVIIENKLKYKVEIVKDYCHNSPTVSGNEGQLHQVFLNLLNNAEQSIQDKGKIEICTKVVDEKVVVDISDNGDGIKKEHLNKITDAFFTTKAPGEGTGLGLSIAYTIINDHKGKLKFESQLNVGTSVKVILPIYNEAES